VQRNAVWRCSDYLREECKKMAAVAGWLAGAQSLHVCERMALILALVMRLRLILILTLIEDLRMMDIE